MIRVSIFPKDFPDPFVSSIPYLLLGKVVKAGFDAQSLQLVENSDGLTLLAPGDFFNIHRSLCVSVYSQKKRPNAHASGLS